MAAFRQMSFAGGELSPTLWGRSDLAKYAVGLKTCRNFFVSRHGAAVSRPGTEYVGTTKNTSLGKVRLIPFVYSEDIVGGTSTAWVLEFGALYIRFWRVSLGTLEPSGGGNLELVTPYTAADLPKLKYAQQGAVMTLCHPNYPPAELMLTGAGYPATFSYAAIDFDIAPASAGSFYLQEPLPQPLGVQWASATTYNSGGVVSYGGLSFQSLADGNTGNAPTDTNWWVPNGGAEVPREWTWAVSEVWQSSRGVLYEKAPVQITKQAVLWYSHWSAFITYVGGAHGVGTQVLSNGQDGGTSGQMYRCIVTCTNVSLGNTSFWVVDNTVSSAGRTQQDALPGTMICSPTNPVTLILNASYVNALTDPNFIGYRVYRGRGGILGLVGDAKWNVETFTDAGDTPDYSQAPPQGTNPFKFYDASGALIDTEYPSCVTFFEGRRFFANTSERPGFYWGSASDDYANFDTKLVPTEDMSIQFELASQKVESIRWMYGWQKLIMGTSASIWAVGGDNGPMAYNNVDAKVQTTVGSSYMTPLAVQGTLLFSRSKGVGVHSLNQDVVRQSWTDKDLTILSEHLFQKVQLADWAYAQDPWQVVWAIRSDGSLLSLTYVLDQDVWAWARHDTVGNFESICTVPGTTEDQAWVSVLRNGQRNIERFGSRVTPSSLSVNSLCCTDATVYQTIAGATVSGLSHLNGMSVMAVVDGNVQGPFTVSGGAITLTVPAVSGAQVGTPFLPQMQVLDVAASAQEVKQKQKTVTRVGIEVDNSRGVFTGPDFNTLTELRQRQVSDSYGPVALASTFYLVNIAGGWTQGGGICLQQNSPLPLTVLSVLREVEFGDY